VHTHSRQIPERKDAGLSQWMTKEKKVSARHHSKHHACYRTSYTNGYGGTRRCQSAINQTHKRGTQPEPAYHTVTRSQPSPPCSLCNSCQPALTHASTRSHSPPWHGGWSIRCCIHAIACAWCTGGTVSYTQAASDPLDTHTVLQGVFSTAGWYRVRGPYPHALPSRDL
jgi:hypothetical protein